MYIRLIDSTLRENEYLFRLNDQQKVYLKDKKVRGNRDAVKMSLQICIRALKCDTLGDRNFFCLANDFVIVV